MYSNIRVGYGIDVHKFSPIGEGDHIFLCGIKIPHNSKIIAHSDGDAALHALTDAMLGAASLGDIGEHFPSTDPQWKDKNSMHFLLHAHNLLHKAGYKLNNLDITIICQRPKVTPYKNAMRDKLSTALEIDKEAVSIKATTTDGLGFTGRKKGILATATVCCIKIADYTAA